MGSLRRVWYIRRIMNTLLRTHGRASGLVPGLMAFALTGSSFAATMYVAPSGRDDGDGSRQRPLASIAAARDAARGLGGSGHVILLAPGRYFHAESVVFDDRDSGLTIRGARPGATTELYGGLPVTGWERWKGNIWRAPVPKGERFFNLIVDGHTATMAQTPNAGSGYGGGAVPVGHADTWRDREHVRVPEAWRNLDYTDAQVYAFHDSNWFSSMLEILEPPDAEGLMRVTKTNIGRRLFIRGVLEFLDEPGEWCLKHKDGHVYYWPKSGNPNDQTIIRAANENLLVIRGRSPAAPARNITIENVSMIGSDFSPVWLPGKDNTSPDVYGMVLGENVEQLAVRNCRLLAAGHSAVFLNKYAQNCLIENNLIMEAGFVGVYMNGWNVFEGPTDKVEDSDVNKGHRIIGNFIYDCGRFVGAGSGVQFYQSGNNLVAHNEIGQMPRYGISYKGLCYVTFGRGEAFGRKITWDNHWDLLHARNNRIFANEIYSVCRDSHDFGAIEAWGPGRDNLWENNAIHDVDATLEWDGYGNILYADDHNHYLTMRNNILYHCNGGAVSTAFSMKSVGQVTENNFVADSDLGIICGLGPFREPTWGSVVRHNVFAIRPKSAVYNVNKGNFEGFTGGILPRLPEGQKGIVEINRNVVTPKDPSKPNPPPYPEFGMDPDSFFGDPGVRRAAPLWDIQYADYSLAPDSPAFKLGFKRIPTDIIGLRKTFPFDKRAATRRNACDKIQAQQYQRMSGLRTEGGEGVHHIAKGAWAKYSNLDFGDGRADRALVQYDAAANSGTLVELRLDSPEGRLIGKLDAGQRVCPVESVRGVHNLYMVFPAGGVRMVDWFRLLLPADAATSSVEAQPAAVANDGVSTGTVTVTVRDHRGNFVPGKTVTLASSRGAADTITVVSDTTCDLGMATFTVHSTTPGDARFRAAVADDKVVVGAQAVVSFSPSATSSARSTVTASPRSLRADGTGAVTVTVQLKDGTNKPVADKTVALEKVSGRGTPTVNPTTAVTDASGQAHFKVTSTEDDTFEFRVHNTTDGMALAPMATVFFTPVADAKPVYSTRADGYTVAAFPVGKGTWTVPDGVTSLEVLVVGGGGGGGHQAGGAGAGGLFHAKTFKVTPGEPVTVAVGNGGAPGKSGQAAGRSGGDSVFGSIVAYGGAGTAGYHSVTTQKPSNAFSVGGEQGGHFDGATFHPGNPGGGTTRFDGAYDSGGGAGAPGVHGNAAVGGIGKAVAITGSEVFYAAGGSALEATVGAKGGAGHRTGGTHGTATYQPVEAGTGAGGQGGWLVDGNQGASGVVIVAYKAAAH